MTNTLEDTTVIPKTHTHGMFLGLHFARLFCFIFRTIICGCKPTALFFNACCYFPALSALVILFAFVQGVFVAADPTSSAVSDIGLGGTRVYVDPACITSKFVLLLREGVHPQSASVQPQPLQTACAC